MRLENIKRYEGKKVEVVLRNGFTYSGTIERVGVPFVGNIVEEFRIMDLIELIDYKKGLVTIGCAAIDVIVEVAE